MLHPGFEPADLETLTRPERWRVLSTAIEPEAPDVSTPRWRRWYARHRSAHAHAELLFVLSGEGMYGMGKAAYACGPGTLMHFAPWATHENGYPPFEPPGRHLWVSLLGDRLTARVLSVGGGRLRHLGPTVLCGEEEVGLSLWPDAVAGPPGAPAGVRRLRLLSAGAAVLAALIARDERPDAGSRSDLQQNVMSAICRHLRETAGRGAGLEQLARIAGYSKYHFHRLFCRHVGCTVLEYVDRCRAERARAMLAEGQPCKRIADALGFSCPAAFSRWRRHHLPGA